MKVLQPSQLKVTELKEELAKRKLPTSGRKSDLVARLEASLQEEVSQQVDVTEDPVESKEEEEPVKTTTTTTKETTTSTNSDQTPNVTTTEMTSAPLSKLSELDKMKKRAERFNLDLVLSDEQKKLKRAERFGNVQSISTPSATQSKSQLEESKMRRAQRFGLPVKGSETALTTSKNKTWSAEDEEKKRKRLERFNPGNGQKKQKQDA